MYRPSLPSSGWEDNVSDRQTLIRFFFINSWNDWSLGIWITSAACSMKSLVKSRTWIRCGNSCIEHSISSVRVGFSGTDKCKIKNHLIDKHLHLSHLNWGFFFTNKNQASKLWLYYCLHDAKKEEEKVIIWIRMNALIQLQVCSSQSVKKFDGRPGSYSSVHVSKSFNKKMNWFWTHYSYFHTNCVE